jgi:hypothetical protein
LAQICKKILPEYKNKKLVMHCQLGGRSGNACQKLLSEDSNLEIYNLEGGISSWITQGNKIEKSGAFFLSLDRQVQLVIGVFVLLGSLLGYFINPIFCFLPAFFGAGLVFAGLSGFCGLALLMAKMPWNQSVRVSSSCSIN